MSLDVSVIVPIYNVELYLQECLDSILKQTGCTFEVICVDDGSTDETPQILKAIAETDSRIRVITQENQGVSVARNRGLEVATGRYVVFMDSDDALAENALEPLVRLADKEQLDHIVFEAKVFADNRGGKVDPKQVAKEERYHTLKDASLLNRVYCGEILFQKLMDTKSFYATTQVRMLRRELIEENNLRFIVGILHEDNHFTPLALLLAKRAMAIPEKYFLRRLRGGSIVTSSGKMSQRAIGCLTAYLKLQPAFEKIRQKNNNIEKVLRSYQALLLDGAMSHLSQVDDGDIEQQVMPGLAQFFSPDELVHIRWMLLSCLEVHKELHKRIEKCRNKRLFSRLKRCLRITRSH